MELPADLQISFTITIGIIFCSNQQAVGDSDKDILPESLEETATSSDAVRDANENVASDQANEQVNLFPEVHYADSQFVSQQ